MIPSIGTTTAYIFLDGQEWKSIFHIVNDDFPIPTDGIISRDFITNHKSKLDYEKWIMELKIGKQKFKTPIFSSPVEGRLVFPAR